MGIDCSSVHKVIHVGPPEDTESYVQHIGRCGRDGKQSLALLLYGKNLMRNTSIHLKEYCRTLECRRNFLFSDFECYTKHDVCIKCCDNCDIRLNCTSELNI